MKLDLYLYKYFRFVTRSFLLCIVISGVFSCYGRVKNSELLKHDPYIKYWEAGDSERLSYPAALRYNNMGVLYTRRLQLDLAEEAFGKALDTNPPRVRPYLNFARLYSLCEEPERARRALARMAENKNISDERLLQAGDDLMQAGLERVAAGIFEETIRVRGTKGKIEFAMRLSEYYLGVAEYSRARRYLEVALSEKPKHKRALYVRGAIHYLARDYERADFYLSLAHKNGEAGENLTYMLADARFRKDKLEAALEAVAIEPRARRGEKLLLLQGRIILTGNWQASLSEIIRDVKDPEVRERLLRNWYGGDSSKKRSGEPKDDSKDKSKDKLIKTDWTKDRKQIEEEFRLHY